MLNIVSEMRAEVEGNRIVGHASVFEQITDIGGYSEIISRGAFDNVLADPNTDVRALWNHQTDGILARQSAGTLRLSVDDTGLAFDLDLPNTTLGNDVRELVKRGDVNGASFGFIPDEEEWEERNGRQIRRHLSIAKLIDVSIVPFPAYPGATVALRNLPYRSGRDQLVRARARILYSTTKGNK